MDYIEIEQSEADGQFFWHRKASNGEIISRGEGHSRERDAIRAARRANPGLAPATLDPEGYRPSTDMMIAMYTRWREYAVDAPEEFHRWLAARSAVDRANALREAADEYRSGQLTGVFLGRDDYPRAWLRNRADQIEGEDTP